MNREEFGAARTQMFENVDDALLPVVRKALATYQDDKKWFAAVVEEAEDLFRQIADREPPRGFARSVRNTLARTKDPENTSGSTDERVTKWLSAYIVNAVEHQTLGRGGTKTWITMHDSDVRASHRLLDGQTVPSGEKFDVGGVKLRFPGEPVGDPAAWINCRCVLQTDGSKSMSSETETFEVGPHLDEENIVPTVDAADLPAEDQADDKIDDNIEVPFYGVAAPVDTKTGDGRQLAGTGFAIRPLPLPLFYQRAQSEGHAGGTIVGQLTRIELVGKNVEYEGKFNYTPEAAEAIQGVSEGWLRGVSVDLDDVVVDMPQFDDETGEPVSDVAIFSQWRVAGLTMVGIPAFHEAFIALGKKVKPEDEKPKVPVDGEKPPVKPEDAEPKKPADPSADKPVPPVEKDEDPKKKRKPFPAPKADSDTETFAPGTHDGPGWITAPVPTGRIRRYWVSGEGAAKIKWGVPGDFNRCRQQLAKYIANPEWLAGACANMHKEATGVWPGRESGQHSVESLIASGAKMAAAFNIVPKAPRELPPGDWFQDPKLSEPTPFTVTNDGRVFGHLAAWGTCHIGYANVCTTPPVSSTEYGIFRTGAIETTLGTVSVGQITMGTGHASTAGRLSAAEAAAHYDNTGTVVADVTAGEDLHGIWVAGKLRSRVTEDQREALKAAALSGDWRDYRGKLELVAALAVNVPGFPIPRTSLAASAGTQEALVASGVVDAYIAPEANTLDFQSQVQEAVRKELARQKRAAAIGFRTQRLREIAAATKAKRVDAVRKRLES